MRISPAHPAKNCFLTRHAAARIKKNTRSSQTKFKVRCSKHLYTLVLKDSDKAEKLKQSLPPSMPSPLPPLSPQIRSPVVFEVVRRSSVIVADVTNRGILRTNSPEDLRGPAEEQEGQAHGVRRRTTAITIEEDD